MRLEHGVDAGAQTQFGETDDAGADARRAIAAARAHGGDAVDEFGLAHRREVWIAVGAIHGAALDEYRAADGVTRTDVGQIVFEQIARAAIPEMMVRIDDRQVGFEDVLAPLREPFLVDAEQGPLARGRRLCPRHETAPVEIPR